MLQRSFRSTSPWLIYQVPDHGARCGMEMLFAWKGER